MQPSAEWVTVGWHDAVMPKQAIDRLSVAQARRITLAAQGFGAGRPVRVTLRHLLGVVERLGTVQIDSVNVLCRAHYMPFFSRLGAYDRSLLDSAMSGQPQRLFEYWGHEASIVLPQTHRELRWRMARWRDGRSHRDRWAAQHPDLLDEIGMLCKQGPMTATQMAAVREAAAREVTAGDRAVPKGSGQVRAKRAWWGNWPAEKMAAELLFGRGVVTSAGRTPQFERRFVLPESVLPPEIVAADDPTEPEAFTELIRIAARAYGVATDRDLRDYFRLSRADAATGIAALAETGELMPVRIDGVRRPTWLHRDARVPRRIEACALLAPFDPLIWERTRLLELFGVHYRIEVYVPQAQRRFGYYVLPFLLGDQIVARVDLKADRQAGVLQVLACHAEQHDGVAEPQQATGALARELALMASWLGLDRVKVADRGDLAPALRSAVLR